MKTLKVLELVLKRCRHSFQKLQFINPELVEDLSSKVFLEKSPGFPFRLNCRYFGSIAGLIEDSTR